MIYNLKKLLPLCPSKRQLTAMEGWINLQESPKRERLLKRFAHFKERVQYYWSLYPSLMVVVVVMVMVVVMVSCKTAAPIVTFPHNDSVVVKYELKHDSVFMDRAHYVYIQGDTIFIHDTVTQKFFSKVNKTDTIYKDKEVVIDHPPEKYIPPFYKWCTAILIICIILFLVYLALRVAKAVYLRK